MKRWVKVALIVTAIAVFLISGSDWDCYVFIESTRMLCKGTDPYMYFDSVRAYIPSLGPMWIAYPPLVLMLWYPGVCILKMLSVPLSLPYLWAVKYVPALFVLLSAYVLRKYYNKTYAIYLLPIVIVAIYLHGMFDSITAFFLLLSTAMLRERKIGKAGLSYGLAVAAKQHALLAIPAFIVYLLRRKHRWKKTLIFLSASILSFALVILTYGLFVGIKRSINDFIEVMLFHLNRPPNGLGFGGFSVISLYSDALNGYSGNIISALVFKGSASVMHGPITVASAPFLLVSIIMSSILFDLEEAILMSYVVYILFSYVGALQHLVVPSIFVPFLSKRERRVFIASTTLYSISHVLAFWDMFPIIFEPLFLKYFNLSEIYISRVMDLTTPYWDVALKTSGMVLTAFGLILLILFAMYEFRKAFNRSFIASIIPIMYVLELAILAIMLSQLKVLMKFPSNFVGHNPVLVYTWENIEYPGYKFGDYLTTPYAIPKYGYFSMVKPLAMKLANEMKKGNYMVLVAARMDLLRSYQVTDLLGALELKGVKWAWAVILSRGNKDYINGIASAPLNEIRYLFFMIKHNIPLRGYASLPPVLRILNETLIKLPPLSAYYPRCENGKPLVYVIPIGSLSNSTLSNVAKLGDRYGLCIKEISIKAVKLWNVKPLALST